VDAVDDGKSAVCAGCAFGFFGMTLAWACGGGTTIIRMGAMNWARAGSTARPPNAKPAAQSAIVRE
jgi:hypothetical protein